MFAVSGSPIGPQLRPGQLGTNGGPGDWDDRDCAVWEAVVDLINKRNLFNFAAVRVLSVYWAAGWSWWLAGTGWSLLSSLLSLPRTLIMLSSLNTDCQPTPGSAATVHSWRLCRRNSLIAMIRLCFIDSKSRLTHHLKISIIISLIFWPFLVWCLKVRCTTFSSTLHYSVPSPHRVLSFLYFVEVYSPTESLSKQVFCTSARLYYDVYLKALSRSTVNTCFFLQYCDMISPEERSRCCKSRHLRMWFLCNLSSQRSDGSMLNCITIYDTIHTHSPPTTQHTFILFK